MARQVLMPTFGMTDGEATLTRWLKQVGETVQADEPLFESENDKATLEVPAPTSGVLLQICVPAGQTVALETVVGWIGQPGEQLALDRNQETNPQPTTVPARVEPTTPAAIKASPIARRLAREHKLDLAALQGSGPGGRIVEKDIYAFLRKAEEPTATPTVSAEAAGTLLPLPTARRIMVNRLSAAAQTAVTVPLFFEIDMSEVQRFREATRADYTQRFGAACSYNALLIRACALALRQHSLLNSQWQDDGVRLLPEIHIGLAVATDDGLLVPVIHHADQKPVSAIEGELNALVRLARQRQLTPQQMAGGTFTITNLGGFGIDFFIPVINPPQSAILGVGAVTDQVVAVAGQPTVRPRMMLCLVFDHRVADGAPAAACCARIKALLENPYLLA